MSIPTFPEKLRQLRDAAGLSEIEMAQQSGLKFGTVHGYVIGRREPPLSAAVALARALGVSVQEFAVCYPAVADGKKPAKPKKADRGK
jgi:transcriptional regulator with XRE-family HTH domain